MKKAIKALALLMGAVLMVGLFAACAPKEEPPAEGGDTPPATSDKTYVIASDNAFAPFEYLDKDGQTYIGLDMDLVAAIAEDQGFKYEMKNIGFDAAETSVQTGQADAMIAGMTIRDDRKENYDFSEGYFQDGQSMVVAKGSAIKSLEDLRGKSVAAKASTMGLDYAESKKEEYGFTVVMYEDSPTMYEAVRSGNNAACFEDRNVIEWAIKTGGLDLETVGEVLNPKDYGFAVKKGTYPELIEMFNKGLANIKASGAYDELLAKYGF